VRRSPRAWLPTPTTTSGATCGGEASDLHGAKRRTEMRGHRHNVIVGGTPEETNLRWASVLSSEDCPRRRYAVITDSTLCGQSSNRRAEPRDCPRTGTVPVTALRDSRRLRDCPAAGDSPYALPKR
jgi:hypothetical protein